MPVGGMIGAAAIGGGASIGGALISSKAQKDASGRAIDAQNAMFDRTLRLAQGYLDPFVTTGTSALTSLAQLYGLTAPDGAPGGQPFSENALEAFKRSPDYAFARSEGMDAVTASAAGKGLLHSGNYLRDLTSFGSGLATQNFGNYSGRLMSLAEIGRGAATSLTGAVTGMGANAGNSLAQLQMAGGQAEASGIVGATNAFSGGVGNLTNNLMLYNMMNRGSAYTPATTFSGMTPISYANSNPWGYTPPSAPMGTGVWPA